LCHLHHYCIKCEGNVIVKCLWYGMTWYTSIFFMLTTIFRRSKGHPRRLKSRLVARSDAILLSFLVSQTTRLMNRLVNLNRATVRCHRSSTSFHSPFVSASGDVASKPSLSYHSTLTRLASLLVVGHRIVWQFVVGGSSKPASDI
jgi:hypothetical protein